MRKIAEPESLSDFEGWRAYLRQQIERAQRRERRYASVAPKDTEYGSLRYHAYGYYRRLYKGGLAGALEQYLGTRTGPPAGGAHLVLRLIDERCRKPLLTGSRRSNVAAELELALRHDVDPLLVLGFLYEVGNQSDLISAFKTQQKPEAAERYRAK